MPNLSDAFLAFGLALVVTWISTPVVKSLAWRIGAIDEPRTRGLHQFPTPRLGGLAILAGILSAGLIFMPHGQQTTGILVGADGDRGGRDRRRPARPDRRREDCGTGGSPQ